VGTGSLLSGDGVLVARMIVVRRAMVRRRRVVTSVSITRSNGLWGSTLCSVPSLIYSVFIEPLQGIHTVMGSMDMAVKDIGFFLKIGDWSVKPKCTDDATVAKYNNKKVGLAEG